jgi:hypothetical protein
VRQERDLGAFVRMWGETGTRVPEEAGLVLDAGKSQPNPWSLIQRKLEPVGKWWDEFLAAKAEKEETY